MQSKIFGSLSIAVLAAGTLSARAQQPAKALTGAAAATTAGTQQVVLPVTVRDKKGAMVTDLKPSDLTLTQDGRTQAITSLARQSDLPFRVGLLVDTSKTWTTAWRVSGRRRRAT